MANDGDGPLAKTSSMACCVVMGRLGCRARASALRAASTSAEIRRRWRRWAASNWRAAAMLAVLGLGGHAGARGGVVGKNAPVNDGSMASNSGCRGGEVATVVMVGAGTVKVAALAVEGAVVRPEVMVRAGTVEVAVLAVEGAVVKPEW